MKKHVLIIHGGEVFEKNEDYLAYIANYKIESLDYFSRTKWKDRFQDELGDEYMVLQPSMPNKRNAQYAAWKMWFEKILSLLDDEVILIGSSLGGLFLAKYLAENKVSIRITKLFLLAAPFNMAELGYDNGDFTPPADYSLITEQCDQIYIYQSKDDKVVPFSEAEKYQQVLPSAILRAFEDKGHLNVPEFPELVADIKQLTDLETLITALQNSWCRETCYEGHQDIWSEDNPALGQCYVTALVLNDYLGGEIMKAKTDDGISHYWNVIDGKEVDLTREQFEPGTEMINPHVVERKDLEPNDRYHQLAKKVTEELKHEI